MKIELFNQIEPLILVVYAPQFKPALIISQ